MAASPDVHDAHTGRSRPQGRAPLLVTGVPRSGTTWLARTLASARRAAMPGREPMNPRGRQFALGGTLAGWVSLQSPTPRQTRLLRRAYRGCEPRTFSRYGVRQWAAPLPWTRLVVKDPFAMLSLRAVCETTDATPVLIYRHPGAVLASYRRMGWRPDVDDVMALGAPPTETPDDFGRMAMFWSFCHDVALDELEQLGRGVLVAHDDLVDGGPDATRALMVHLGLDPADRDPDMGERSTSDRGRDLHQFDRQSHELATGWRSSIEDSDIARLEALTAAIQTRLTDSTQRWRPQDQPR